MSAGCKGCGGDLPPSNGPRTRIWCSEKCRKAQYGGECKSCGAATDGGNGRDQAPDYCKDCAPDAYAKWPPERIIEKMREWASKYGRPPSAMDWNPATARSNPTLSDELAERKVGRYESGDWPATNTVVYRFGSWTAGLTAAGFKPNPAGRPGRWEKAA